MNVAFQKITIGGKVYRVDWESGLLLTKGDWDKAQRRYQNQKGKNFEVVQG